MGFEIASGTHGGKSTCEGELCTMSRLVGQFLVGSRSDRPDQVHRPCRSFLSGVCKMVKLILVMPATNVVSEGSLSNMQGIKNYLDSAKRQHHQHRLMTLNVYPIPILTTRDTLVFPWKLRQQSCDVSLVARSRMNFVRELNTAVGSLASLLKAAFSQCCFR